MIPIRPKRFSSSIFRRSVSLFTILLFLGATSSIQSQDFGKNKVQYRAFDWKFIQSAHFDVYFYNDAGLNLATFTAEVAEDALSSLQEHLRFSISERISLVVYNSKNDFQQTNVVSAYMPEGVGGVTELFKNRVVVPFEGDWEKFRHVIHHELVHAVLNDKFYGGSIQSIIQNNIRVELPIWMNEGLAEFEAYDGYNAETDMFIRDAVIGEYMPELYQMDGYFAYRGGQSFYWYVAENYGRDKIGELLNRVKRSASLDAAFQGAFGKGLEDFSEQFLYDLKKTYWPDITDRKRPRDFARELTDHEGEGSFMNASPSISPDGLSVAFISDRDGPRSVYVMSVDDRGSARKLIEGERNVEFEELHLLSPAIAWAPDSRRVAMAVKSKGKDVIFLIDVKSGDREKLSFDLDAIYSVDWSPDGSHLAFQGIKGDMSDIYTYDLKKSELRNLTNDLFSDYDPKWAEDNQTIYFLSDRKDNPIRSARGLGYKIWNYDYQQTDIYSLNTTSLDLQRITSDLAMEKTPTPSPDGSLFYVSDVNGIYNIYVFNKPGEEPRPVTNSITAIEQLTITPDASKMVFSAWNGRGYDIFLLLAPLELNLAEDKLEKTTYVTQAENSVDTTEAFVEPENVTVVTDVVGYDDVAIDLDESIIAESPDDRLKPTTYTKSANPPLGAVDKDGNYVLQDYKVKLSMDVFQATGVYDNFYGFQSLVQALFSDELGDHNIYLAGNLQFDLINSDFYAYYDYLEKRIDYQFGLFQNSLLFRVGALGDIARFRQLGGSVTASNPFDRFRRVEVGATLMNVSRETLEGESFLNDQSKFLAMPNIRYVFDNTETLIFSPVSGSRYYINLLGSPRIGDDGVGFWSATTDFRHYIPLDKLGLYDIAFRLSGGASFGPDPQQFFIGGMDGFWINSDFTSQGIPISDAEDYSLVTPGFPLRGYDWGESIGSKYGLVNLELRYPLLLFGSGGVLSSILQLLTGTVFLDVGAAWDEGLNLTTTDLQGRRVADDLRMGSGIGLRSFVLGFPLRLDVAWSYNLNSWGKPKYYLSVGQDF